MNIGSLLEVLNTDNRLQSEPQDDGSTVIKLPDNK